MTICYAVLRPLLQVLRSIMICYARSKKVTEAYALHIVWCCVTPVTKGVTQRNKWSFLLFLGGSWCPEKAEMTICYALLRPLLQVLRSIMICYARSKQVTEAYALHPLRPRAMNQPVSSIWTVAIANTLIHAPYALTISKPCQNAAQNTPISTSTSMTNHYSSGCGYQDGRCRQ